MTKDKPQTKATPRPWAVDKDNPTLVFLDDGLSPYRYVANFDTTAYGFSGSEDESRARQAVQAVNFYNPQRDKLARELAAT
jgi:hypothetical protein